jgi:hypothetical protein
VKPDPYVPRHRTPGTWPTTDRADSDVTNRDSRFMSPRPWYRRHDPAWYLILLAAAVVTVVTAAVVLVVVIDPGPAVWMWP